MTKDMTTGSPARLILFFTIPLLIGNLFQQLYNMADTLIVGRTIGVNALAAVGCTGSIMFLIIGFAQGLTSGLAIVTAQRFGARDLEGVRKSFAACAVLSLWVTVVLTAVSVCLARPILRLLQTPPEIIDDAYRYIVVIFSGIAAAMLFNLLSNVLRALGDSRTPLVFLVLACLINIALDFTFILALRMGVAGAAVATVIAQLCSGVLCVFYMRKKFPALWPRREDFRLNRQEVREHLRVALPMGFQSSIIAIGAIILQFTLNGLGALSVAAYTAAQKIDMLATQPVMSFGVTMATYAAQNYGAGNIPRIRQGVRQCCIMSVSFSVVMGIVNMVFGGSLAGIFVGSQPQVMRLARVFLTINGSLYFTLALLFIFRYTLQGLGQSVVPTIAGIMELVMRSFAAVILAKFWGFAGACMANPLAWIGSMVPLAIAFLATMRRLCWQVPRASYRQAPPAPAPEEPARTGTQG